MPLLRTVAILILASWTAIAVFMAALLLTPFVQNEPRVLGALALLGAVAMFGLIGLAIVALPLSIAVRCPRCRACFFPLIWTGKGLAWGREMHSRNAVSTVVRCAAGKEVSCWACQRSLGL